jgi:hypothetical protein
MRTIATVLAVALAALVAGCGDSDEPEQSTVSVTVPTTSTEATTTDSTVTDDEAATGGEGESGDGAVGPILAVAGVLTKHATTEEACGSFVTENFLETAYGGRENCEAARGSESLAEEVALDPKAKNTATHMTVIPDGGPYDGVKVEVEVVEVNGRYKVDALVADVPAGP